MQWTTCAAEFNNYNLQGPNITGRGQAREVLKTYSLPAGGQEKLQGPIGCRAVEFASRGMELTHMT